MNAQVKQRQLWWMQLTLNVGQLCYPSHCIGSYRAIPASVHLNSLELIQLFLCPLLDDVFLFLTPLHIAFWTTVYFMSTLKEWDSEWICEFKMCNILDIRSKIWIWMSIHNLFTNNLCIDESLNQSDVPWIIYWGLPFFPYACISALYTKICRLVTIPSDIDVKVLCKEDRVGSMKVKLCSQYWHINCQHSCSILINKI